MARARRCPECRLRELHGVARHRHDYGPLPGVEAGVDALAAGDVAVDRGADAASPPADAGDEGFVFPADAGAATKLTLGDFHSCALFGGSGYAKCWGRGLSETFQSDPGTRG